MRKPTSGMSEEDLSQLTKSSITTSSSSGTTQWHINDNNNTFLETEQISNLIDPFEWQKSRKRKERQDSTSSILQDRKLIRSNSEELIFTGGRKEPSSLTNIENFSNNTITRRVLSHENLKNLSEQQKSLENQSYDYQQLNNNYNNNINNNNNNNNTDETCVSKTKPNKFEIHHKSIINQLSVITSSSSSVSPSESVRYETSPARSYKFLSNQEYNLYNNTSNNINTFKSTMSSSIPLSSKENNMMITTIDDYYEYEKRRSNERSCKSRANYPGRKLAVIKKFSKNLINKNSSKYQSENVVDENCYKYDLAKCERRGFVSKVKLEERNRKVEAADGEQIPPNDFNDNNLIDFHHIHDDCKCSIVKQKPQQSFQQQNSITASLPLSSFALPLQITSILSSPSSSPVYNQQQQQNHHSLNNKETIAESLPWNSTVRDQQDQVPILCRRFASIDSTSVKIQNDDNNFISNNLQLNNEDTSSKTKNQCDEESNQNQEFIALESQLPPPTVIVDDEPIKSFRVFTTDKIENIKTREIMQVNAMQQTQGYFRTPEERLKHINKKLQALKKRVIQLEESYEKKYGYRPSQVEKFSDKQIKSVLAEIGKLRKEKYDLKSDPMTILGYRVNGGMDAEKRLIKIKETLEEIEKKLEEKREENNRPENLDEMNTDQLMHEKAAIQHSLLYFESLYGRPLTKEERDAARPLYDRYRILKRMVSRSVSTSTAGGVSELPTILEHEAMTFNVSGSMNSEEGSVTELQQNDQQQINKYQHEQDDIISNINKRKNSIEDVMTIIPSTSNDYQTSVIQSPTSSCSSSIVDTQSYDSGGSTTESTESGKQQPQEQQSQQQNDSSGTFGVAENIHTLSLDELWELLEKAREEKKQLKRTVTEYETIFEEQNGRKMLKSDRKFINDTYIKYKEKKAKVRLLQALIKKHTLN